MSTRNKSFYNEGQPQQPQEEEKPKRLDARPRNNVYAEGTGKGTGTAALRIGTRNRDGSLSGCLRWERRRGR